ALQGAGCRPPAYGCGVCFPDVAFEVAPSQADLQTATLGAQDLAWLGQAVLTLVERVVPAPRGQAGNWITRLRGLWGETWKPRLALGHRVRVRAEERVMLDARQLEVLEQLEGNEHLLVEGPAGSGKTLIAREAAIRFAEGGRRVLLLTFTEALALWLRHSIEVPGVEVAPVRL